MSVRNISATDKYDIVITAHNVNDLPSSSESQIPYPPHPGLVVDPQHQENNGSKSSNSIETHSNTTEGGGHSHGETSVEGHKEKNETETKECYVFKLLEGIAEFSKGIIAFAEVGTLGK